MNSPTTILFGQIQATLRQAMKAQTKRIKGFGYLQGCVDYGGEPITTHQAKIIGDEIAALMQDIDTLTSSAIKIQAAYHRLIKNNPELMPDDQSGGAILKPKPTQNNGNTSRNKKCKS